jgi:hypothetical protein
MAQQNHSPTLPQDGKHSARMTQAWQRQITIFIRTNASNAAAADPLKRGVACCR